jgi:LmbE family N-acetylglucosaminyl deacetylase
MTPLIASKRTLVVAPHRDDEVLGCGGTIARLADAGTEVHVIQVTNGVKLVSAERDASIDAEADAAAAILGISKTHRLGLPAAQLDTLPRAEINQRVDEVVRAVEPDLIFTPFPLDLHTDHQIVYYAAMVAARPLHAGSPRCLLCYETLSETNWNAPFMSPFVPSTFVDISATFDRKLQAMRTYRSQLRDFPHERSIEAMTALAQARGATVFRRAAEAFMMVRCII